MKARPILFSAPMIRALLDGRKTQTRRVVNPQPKVVHAVYPDGSIETERIFRKTGMRMRCPYGAPGELLWARETHYLTDDGHHEHAIYAADQEAVAEHLSRISELPADFPAAVREKHRRSRPSIHMPRWASRLTLRITDVRAQRLQEISGADAWAEGIEHSPDVNPIHGYEALWESINGASSWAANPWVWALTFEVLKANVDQVIATKAAT